MPRALAVLLSAGLYGLAFPPFGLAGLSWVALVPLLWALNRSGPLQAAGLAYGWGLFATLGLIAWVVPTLHEHFEAPLGFGLAFWVGLGATTAAPYAAVALAGYAWAARRMPPALRPLWFAISWVCFEFARSETGLRSPWGSLAQAQADAPWLLQLAAVTGTYGVSALVAWTNAVLAELLALRRAPVRSLAALTVPLLVALGLATTWGSSRLVESEPGAFEVAVVQGNVAPELRWRRTAAGRVLRRYGSLTHDLLRQAGEAKRPDLVIWPENAIQTALDDPTYGEPLRGLARHGVPLLFGAPRSEFRDGQRRHFNSAFLLRPDGRSEHYDKRRLLPFSETRPFGNRLGIDTPGDVDAATYSPGERPGLFDVAGHRLGVLICVEALDARLARELSAAGATLLVNLSNESWFGGRGGADQHFQQAVLRAVENGVPLVRATTSGVTGLIAADGRVVAALAAAQTAVLRQAVPAPRPGGTFYRRHGDVFAVLCATAWLAGLASRRRASQTRSGASAPRDAA